VSVTGALAAVAALNSLLRPDRAGLFQIAPDHYQLRVLGLSPGYGEQMLAPWMALILIALGACCWSSS
jgi:hypothetical protein